MEEYNLRDRIIRCKDCSRRFTFDVDEQKKFGQLGWQAPIRCKECRQRRRFLRMALEDGVKISDMEVHEALCAGCGRKFLSSWDVKKNEKEYCSECWREIKIKAPEGER